MLTVRTTKVGDRLALGPSAPPQWDAVKAIGGARWEPAYQRWTVPATIPAAVALAAVAAEHDFRFSGLDELLAAAAKSAVDLPDFPGKTSGWLHQRQAYTFAIERAATMLALGMGTGKSKIAVGLCEGWWAEKVLVIAPKKATTVWPGQFAQHAAQSWNVPSGAVRGRSGKILKNPTISARLKHFTQALALTGPTAIVLNYEMLVSKLVRDWLAGVAWDVVIFDESHRIKSPGGKWSRAAMKIKAPRRLALTGTPMPHSPPDLYAQFRALDPSVYGTSYARYRQRFFRMGGFENREVVGWNDEAGHTAAFKAASFIAESKDVLDLPPTQDLPHTYVELGEDGRRHYDELHEEFITAVGDGVVTAANALTRLLREQQVTSGHLPSDTDCRRPKRATTIGTEKADALAEILGDLPYDEPVVVFARFTHDLDEIMRVALEANRIYGEISGRRDDGLTALAPRRAGKMADGVQVCGVQIAAGGEGIDLTRARYAVYYSMGFSLGQYQQSRARIHRPGQERSTMYLHILAANTIDTQVYRALKAKKQVVDAIIEEAKG